VNKFDGLVHAQNRAFDPASGEEIHNPDYVQSGPINEMNIQLLDHPISDSRDDKWYEQAYE